MTATGISPTDIADDIARHLPMLRRYARALTGAQASGDSYAVATLEAVLEDRALFDTDLQPKVALFKAFHAIWSSAGGVDDAVDPSRSQLEAAVQDHLSQVRGPAREALLMHAIEGFPISDIAVILDNSVAETQELLDIAAAEMESSIKGRVMIIEDEAIIAMDIHSIVAAMGHEITGIARTRAAAVEMGTTTRPDLILADIQLADKSSGIDAVNDLLAQFGHIPVIFITAFPERLLTGERPEPAFLISKPYSEEQVRAAISQAIFFSSTKPLESPS